MNNSIHNANHLNKLVEIWKYYPSTNTAGTPVERLLFYKNAYAYLKVDSGGVEVPEATGELPRTNVTIVIRYDKEIDYKCEIRYKGQKYKITYIQDDENQFLKLICVTYNEYD